MIYRELCKNLKFDPMNKGYMHKPENVPENEWLKLFGILKYKQIT